MSSEEKLIKTLSSLTYDLSVPPDVSVEELDTARLAILRSFLNGQQTNTFGRMSSKNLPPAGVTGQTLEQLLAQLDASNIDQTRVVRRDSATVLSPDPRVNFLVGGGQKAAHSYGPFIDGFGRLIAVDVFATVQLTSFERAGAQQPFLYISAPPFTGSQDTITLGSGSVWIDASALASNVPDSSFIGLQIESGTVQFSTPIALGSSPISVPINVVVTLKLHFTASGSSTVANASVSTPADATFTFTNSGGGLSNATEAKVTAFGTTAQLGFHAGPAQYNPLNARFDFPFSPLQSQFTVKQGTFQLANFSGKSSIMSSAWSLPINTASPTTLGTAAGAGGMGLVLSAGLQVLVYGRDLPITCGPCTVVVEPNFLSVDGSAAEASYSTQYINLWQQAKVSVSKLTIRTPSKIRFRYIIQSNGNETWANLANLVAALDSPRTVNNLRTRFAGTSVFILTKTGVSSPVQLMIEGVAPSERQPSIPQTYAIKNLLLKTNGPQILIVIGNYANGAIPEGKLSMTSDLVFLLPILPDPYATNISSDVRSLELEELGTQVTWTPTAPVVIDLSVPASALAQIKAAQDTTNLIPQLQNSAVVKQIPKLPTLLDLSTNVSQFGVAYSLSSDQKGRSLHL